MANAATQAANAQTAVHASDVSMRQAFEIAKDPLKAFEYGKDNTWIAKRKVAKGFGYKKFTFYHKISHTSLFSSKGRYNYRNESKEQVITEIELGSAVHPDKMSNIQTAQRFKTQIMNEAENSAKLKEVIVGEKNEDLGFIHKKDINKATANIYLFTSEIAQNTFRISRQDK